MLSLKSFHKNKHHLTIVAALLAMVGPFTIDAYLPSFPAIESAFGVGRAMLSQSLAVYLLAFAISTLFWGPLADRIGRRLVILISLSLYSFASIGCALSEQIDSFMLFRVLQGLAASGGFIASRAMIRDAHDAQSAHRAMAQVSVLFAIAPAIAPVFGAWLHSFFGWRSVFWFLTLFGALMVAMMFFVGETLSIKKRQSFHPTSVLKVYIQTIKHKQFPLMSLSLSCSFAGVFLYIAGAPTVIYDFLGLDSNDFGLQFIPMVTGLMLGAFVSSRLSHAWTSNRIILTGFGIMIFGTLLNISQLVLFEVSVLSVIGPLVIYVFGLAMLMPAITILALDCFPHNRGAAASMQGFFQMGLNAAVASIAVPLLHTKLQHFVLGQVFFLSLALTLWYFSKRPFR